MAESEPEWAVPPWMELYRATFALPRGRTLEEVLNDPTSKSVDLERWLATQFARIQFAHILRLEESGLLRRTKRAVDRRWMKW